jgi:hypothetical protein
MTLLKHNVKSALVGLTLGSAAMIATSASAVECTNFDPPGGGAPWPCCGVVFTYDGIDFETRPFLFTTGVPTVGGFAEPQPSCNGAAGPSLNVNNVNVDVKIETILGTPGVQRIRFFYRDAGGNVNLGVNGHLEWTFDDFHLIPAAPYAAVGVNVITPAPMFIGGAWEGEVIVEALPGHCITQFSFGGQELCVDDLCAWWPCSTCPEDLDGDGAVSVSDLLILLGDWGGGGPADLNGDGTIDVADLLLLLSAWGAC